jgi:hypothetical protein
VVEHLPNNCNVLSSNSGIPKKRKEKLDLGCNSVVECMLSMNETLGLIPTIVKK